MKPGNGPNIPLDFDRDIAPDFGGLNVDPDLYCSQKLPAAIQSAVPIVFNLRKRKKYFRRECSSEIKHTICGLDYCNDVGTKGASAMMLIRYMKDQTVAKLRRC